MSAETPGDPPSSGLRGGLGRLATGLLGLAHTRLELAAVELAEERERLVFRLVLALVAVVGFSCTLIALTVLVVICFWDTNRIAAIGGVALFYLAVGGFALWRLLAAPPTPAFAATLETIEHDRDWVARQTHSGT